MNKIQLKEYLTNIDLEPRLMELFNQLIDEAPEVNQELLNVIADILELQADIQERLADAYLEESNIYSELADNIQDLDDQATIDRLNALAEVQEKLSTEIDNKINSFKLLNNTQQATVENVELTNLRNSISQAAV